MHFKKYSRLLITLMSVVMGLGFVACQKADPAPYSNPQYGLGTQTVTAVSEPSAVFQASVSHSSVINFAPAKAIGNGQVQLIGSNATYTLTITFPNKTGPGQNYFLGGTPGFGASVNNGADLYSVAYHGAGVGALNIDSISHGKYYGSFNFDAQDASHNDINVSSGVFSNL